MYRDLPRVVFLVLVCAGGCAKDEDYLSVIRDQTAAYREVAEVLKSIHDEKSMSDAKSTLELKAKTFEAIAERARALPKPPPASVLRRMEDEKLVMQSALDA